MKSRRKTREIVLQVLYSESMSERGRVTYLENCKEYLKWLNEFKSEETFEKVRDVLLDIFNDIKYKRVDDEDEISFILPDINSKYNVAFATLDKDYKQDQFLALSQKIINDYNWKHKSKRGTGELPDASVDFFRSYINFYLDNVKELDDLIISKIHNWDYPRVNIMDKIIIRMGLTEFLYFDEVPSVVTINEAIELGKRFSANKSGKFINGILNSLKEIKSEDKS